MGVCHYMAREFVKEIGNRSKEFYEFVSPPVDIFEEGAELVIVIDLPGFQKKDIQLSISRDILTIRAKRTLDLDSVTVHFRQRPSKIGKRIPLPISNADQENVNSKASYVNGVITLRIPLPQTSNIPIT